MISGETAWSIDILGVAASTYVSVNLVRRGCPSGLGILGEMSSKLQTKRIFLAAHSIGMQITALTNKLLKSMGASEILLHMLGERCMHYSVAAQAFMVVPAVIHPAPLHFPAVKAREYYHSS